MPEYRASTGRRLATLLLLLVVATGSGCAARNSATTAEEQLSGVPVLPALGKAKRAQFKHDLKRSIRVGMNPRSFAKIGDSNIASYYTIYGLGCRKVLLGRHQGLASVLHRYRSVRHPIGRAPASQTPGPGECLPSNSFSRVSAGARVGAILPLLLTPIGEIGNHRSWTPDPACRPSETMTTCELRIVRPRYTLINVGTNDATFWSTAGQEGVSRISDLVRQTRAAGSIPVLLTLPPYVKETREGEGGSVVRMNQAIVEASRRLRTPLLNVWRAMMKPSMVNFGMRDEDGLHLETFGGTTGPGALARSADLRPAALRYGNNRRNLLILKTLRRLDRIAGVN